MVLESFFGFLCSELSNSPESNVRAELVRLTAVEPEVRLEPVSWTLLSTLCMKIFQEFDPPFSMEHIM